ncbi:DUF6783 domain-containing protein [Robinsoniella peoriensis]
MFENSFSQLGKSPAKWGVQIAVMNFQTRSGSP